jgi:hypothetical protein
MVPFCKTWLRINPYGLLDSLLTRLDCIAQKHALFQSITLTKQNTLTKAIASIKNSRHQTGRESSGNQEGKRGQGKRGQIESAGKSRQGE